MAVPNTSTFSMQDVVNEIGGGSDLQDLFTRATGTFDPAYVGNKDGLLNFRNYDHTGFLFETTANNTGSFNSIGVTVLTAQIITAPSNLSTLSVEILAERIGFPETYLWASIYNVSGGVPTTKITTSSNSTIAGNLPSYTEFTPKFNFSGLSLISGTQYGIIMEYGTTAVLNSSNYMKYWGSNTDDYVGGYSKVDTGGGWSSPINVFDFRIRVYGG